MVMITTFQKRCYYILFKEKKIFNSNILLKTIYNNLGFIAKIPKLFSLLCSRNATKWPYSHAKKLRAISVASGLIQIEIQIKI